MSPLQNIAMWDYQESVTNGQTNARQSDPYVPLWFADDTKMQQSHYYAAYCNTFYWYHQCLCWKKNDKKMIKYLLSIFFSEVKQTLLPFVVCQSYLNRLMTLSNITDDHTR